MVFFGESKSEAIKKIVENEEVIRSTFEVVKTDAWSSFDLLYKNQYKIELAHVARLRKHIKTCFDKSDFGTKEMLDGILKDTEDSVDWLETQFNRIKDIGIKNYMMENMSKDDN